MANSDEMTEEKKAIREIKKSSHYFFISRSIKLVCCCFRVCFSSTQFPALPHAPTQQMVSPNVNQNYHLNGSLMIAKLKAVNGPSRMLDENFFTYHVSNERESMMV